MMIEINRKNIETCLLRHVDGELTPLEKMAVENDFVLNPDLAGELKALHQAQLPKEAVLFPFKSALLKRIQTEFSEEQLLDYIDGETDTFTTDAIREAVLDDAALVEQLNLLEQTKLPLENIEMPNKASLYRHE
jgi:anti-sigma factor RsiW